MSQQKILRELNFLAVRTLGRGIWESPSQTAQTSKPLSSRTLVFLGLPGRTAIADQLLPPGPVHDTKGTCHSVERVHQKGKHEQGRGRAFLVF